MTHLPGTSSSASPLRSARNLEAEQARLQNAQPATELADYAGPGITNAWARSATYTGKQVTRPVGDADHHSCVGQGERSDV
jgi:hypothetical protein